MHYISSEISRMNLYLDIFPMISFTFSGSYVMRTIHEILWIVKIFTVNLLWFLIAGYISLWKRKIWKNNQMLLTFKRNYVINTGFGSNGILSHYEHWSWYVPTFGKKIQKFPHTWNVHLKIFEVPWHLKCTLWFFRGSLILLMYPLQYLLA